jgi:hypothetical protein
MQSAVYLVQLGNILPEIRAFGYRHTVTFTMLGAESSSREPMYHE